MKFKINHCEFLNFLNEFRNSDDDLILPKNTKMFIYN